MAVPILTPVIVGCVVGVVAPWAIVTVGVTVTMLVSLLLRFTVRAESAGEEREIVSVPPEPMESVALEGTTTFPVVPTFTVAVASGMNGLALAWMIAVPIDTEVTGTLTLVADAAKVAVLGTVATLGLAELKFTINPVDGAGAERFRRIFWVPIPLIFSVCGENETVAVVCAVPVPDV